MQIVHMLKVQSRQLSHVNAVVMEEMVTYELGTGITGMTKNIPNITNLIAPIINTDFALQEEKGYVNFKKFPLHDDDLWQTSIFINARTSEFHTESDSTYTAIHIPQQETKLKSGEYHFVFKIKDRENVSITLSPGISFLFLGKILTHRQSCTKAFSCDDELFINFSSYGTTLIFSYLKNMSCVIMLMKCIMFHNDKTFITSIITF